jgi:hypothetical protein
VVWEEKNKERGIQRGAWDRACQKLDIPVVFGFRAPSSSGLYEGFWIAYSGPHKHTRLISSYTAVELAQRSE